MAGNRSMSAEFYFDSIKEFIAEALANKKNRTAVLRDGRYMT